MHSDVLILGGGITGLSLAEAVCERGLRASVVEREAVFGGLLRSLDFGGQRFDSGPHGIYTHDEEVVEWFRRHLNGEMAELERRSVTLFRGRRVPYPLRIPSTLRAVRVHEAVRVVAEAVLQRLFKGPPPPGACFERWSLHSFGPTLHRLFLRDYTEKVWGRPCAELSASWVSAHLPANSLLQVLFNQLKQRKLPIGFVSRFQYCTQGCGYVIERLVDALRRNAGAALLPAARPLSVRRAAGEWVCRVSTQDGERVLSARHVVSTIPVARFLELVDPAPPAEVLASARGLAFRNLILVLMIVDRPRVSDANWVYVPDRERLVCRVSEPKNMLASMHDRPDTSLTAEILCEPDAPLWRASDAELIERALADLEALRLVGRNELKAATILRLPDAYPVFDLSYEARMERVRGYLGGQDGLHVLGRTGGFAYLDQAGCVRQALAWIEGQYGRRTES